ncbi:MAG: type I DNA topoisomerase [Candidatus Levybacteria bacterium]|nr:type I DNA topoisomerase [Candidatus Levybacteria bacterium]
MNLVIVESPTKARTIGRFLGKEYDIKASMGHIMDLPKSTLGVDVDRNFAPLYEVVADKKKIIAELKMAAKGATQIILATDPDREGEAISAHVKEVLMEDKKLKVPASKFVRIVFHEITKEAIEEALTHPGVVDENLVNAQTARRVLDRLVGYKLSPLLWQKVRRGLSAGRVQSVALRLIVEREKEIEKFAKQPYYTITALLQNSSLPLTLDALPLEGTSFDLIAINDKKIESQNKYDLYDGQYTVTKTTIDTEKAADEIVTDLQKAGYTVSDITEKEMRRSPQAPYTTSTLQQDASRRLGLAGRRSMSLAQKLYEEGYITYHRTDSTNIAVSAQTAMISYVKKTYGDKYVPEKPRVYATKQKNAQEAHEAIRPTKVEVSGDQVSQDLGPQYGKFYELIWRRAVASQMSDAITQSTSVLVDAVSTMNPELRTPNTYRLKANGSVLVFEGFLKINPQALADNRLPEFTVDEKLTAKGVVKEFHETPPPPRYNDASIIKTLEEKSIGRPSTYATIIGTIESRGYITRENARFTPTAVGNAVNDFLVKNFSDIDDIPFTADMEDSLDLIAEGKKEWLPMISSFYKPFEKKIEEVKGSDRVKIAVEETDEPCSECKEGHLVVRTGKFGKFLSCNRFPDCKFTKPLVEETAFLCPKDGGKVIIKKTRKGRKFFGCSNYPNCEFAAWKAEDIQNYDPNAVKKPARNTTQSVAGGEEVKKENTSSVSS